jgi:hypothetical protein
MLFRSRVQMAGVSPSRAVRAGSQRPDCVAGAGGFETLHSESEIAKTLGFGVREVEHAHLD